MSKNNNFYKGSDTRDFYFWVDPKNFISFHNIAVIGQISNPPLSQANNQNENLLFIPNPNYKHSFVTPYHNNITKRIRAEYSLEIGRPLNYPSRMQALYLLDSKQDAEVYKQIHMSHVNDRVLIVGKTVGEYIYSIHDSGWFDYLCLDANFDSNTVKNCVDVYWEGFNIVDFSGKISLYGHAWSQPPTRECLFLGNIQILEDSKLELCNRFKEEYMKNPWNYPTTLF